jgi:hypothetical protein
VTKDQNKKKQNIASSLFDAIVESIVEFIWYEIRMKDAQMHLLESTLENTLTNAELVAFFK